MLCHTPWLVTSTTGEAPFFLSLTAKGLLYNKQPSFSIFLSPFLSLLQVRCFNSISAFLFTTSDPMLKIPVDGFERRDLSHALNWFPTSLIHMAPDMLTVVVLYHTNFLSLLLVWCVIESSHTWDERNLGRTKLCPLVLRAQVISPYLKLNLDVPRVLDRWGPVICILKLWCRLKL